MQDFIIPILIFAIVFVVVLVVLKRYPTTLMLPSEKKVNSQKKTAILLTIVASVDGYVMISIGSPEIILCEIFIVACAGLQWSIYYNSKTKLEIEEMLLNKENIEER